MTLMDQLVAAVAAQGRATIDTLAPQLPQYTKKQLSNAINRASSRKRIELLDRPPAAGYGQGQPPAVYGPITQHGPQMPWAGRPRPPNSVFELGIRT